MILHDYECSDGHITERWVRADQSFVKCECGKRAVRVYLSNQQRNAQRFHPVVYLEDATGKVVIPPADDGEVMAMMPDCVRKEARTLSEVRALTKHMDRQSKEEFYKYQAKKQTVKRGQVDRNMEFALRAREKMSHPGAQKIVDYAIEKMQRQRTETIPDFKPSGHFLAFE